MNGHVQYFRLWLLFVQCQANIAYQATLGPPAKLHLNDPIAIAVCWMGGHSIWYRACLSFIHCRSLDIFFSLIFFLPIILDDPRVICVAIFSLHICNVLAPHVVIFIYNSSVSSKLGMESYWWRAETNTHAAIFEIKMPVCMNGWLSSSRWAISSHDR